MPKTQGSIDPTPRDAAGSTSAWSPSPWLGSSKSALGSVTSIRHRGQTVRFPAISAEAGTELAQRGHAKAMDIGVPSSGPVQVAKPVFLILTDEREAASCRRSKQIR